MITKVIGIGIVSAAFMGSNVCAQGIAAESEGQPESAGEAAKFIGSWTALPCSTRSYPRILIVNADGTFNATDWVKPANRSVSSYTRAATFEHQGTWRLRNPGMIELSSTGTGSRGVVSMPGAIAFDSQTGRLREATPGAPELCEYNRSGAGPSLDSGDPGEASVCHDAVQGQIAWDYQGNKSWGEGNVMRLCTGAAESPEPARCFEAAMHSGMDRGDDSEWNWTHAIELCAGTTDANATLQCFAEKISTGNPSSDAIAGCSAIQR